MQTQVEDYKSDSETKILIFPLADWTVKIEKGNTRLRKGCDKKKKLLLFCHRNRQELKSPSIKKAFGAGMGRGKLRSALSIAMVLIFFLGVSAALVLDSDFGKIKTASITVIDKNRELSGLLYRPRSAVAENPAAAVVIAHGIGGSKEMMSNIGLELARRGFVSLCLDLLGHGKSQGTVEEGEMDPSFGVSSAVQYLKTQSYVNVSSLGLVGHSLGAGAVRATIPRENQILATVLIAGGLGDIVEQPQYGVFNSTYPRNLLVIVGKYDILFDIEELTTKELPIIFGTQQEVAPNVLYGEFSEENARKLVIPLTTHLFEPVDPIVISETVAWMENTLGQDHSASSVKSGLIYVQRETAIIFALVGLFGITFLSYFPIAKLLRIKNQKSMSNNEKGSIRRWKLYTVWAVINLTLLVPMFGVGSIVSFPPLIFGASTAWWMMGSGLIGLLVLAKFSKRILGRTVSLREKLKSSFGGKDVAAAIISFIIILAITTVLADAFNFTIRIISPIFRDFSSISRILVFPAFIPFLLSYFVAESLFLHELPHHESGKPKRWGEISDYAEPILGKTLPFIVLLAVHYTAKIIFDFWILPGFVGFLMEFLWLILPIFIITTSFSWWFHKKTGRISYGAVFNALLMSWVASVVFPF